EPGLKLEARTNVNVAVRRQSARVRSELARNRNAIAHFIYITPTGSFIHVTPADSLRVYRYAEADARLTGGEASLGIDLSTPLSLDGRFDAVRGTNRATDAPLPLVPPAGVALG